MKISKKLVSAVLGEKVAKTGVKDSLLLYTIDGIEMKTINLYEFIHKNCKEWVLSKGYPFNVLYKHDYWDRLEKKYEIDLYNHRKSFLSDSEQETIIKACEWILSEIQ